MDNNNYNYILPGRFSELGYDSNDVNMLDDAWAAVTKAEKWGYLKEANISSFMFGNYPEVEAINKHMKYEGHSGCSYGWTMRQMEGIAKLGWQEYVVARFAAVDRYPAIKAANPGLPEKLGWETAVCRVMGGIKTEIKTD
uniref:Uncharacterized protein n=1 Tax=viral metagenome TaxID=1070528 RepID=A0A6C0I8H4_9ZZZZ